MTFNPQGERERINNLPSLIQIKNCRTKPDPFSSKTSDALLLTITVRN